jgi:inorganic pyrophosphatase
MNFDAVVEIPKGSRVKYEFDETSHRFRVNRVLPNSVAYPCNYGFLPNSLSTDGDPADILIPSVDALEQGCIIEVRPVGVLHMIDGGQEDHKIFAVPTFDVYWKKIHDIKQVPEDLLVEIRHFFKIYKMLGGKKVKVKQWGSRQDAIQLLKKSIKRYKKSNGTFQ